MALYNHTAKLFANGEVSITDLKCMLLGAGYTFSAAHTNISSATSAQVSGNGWTSGGEALDNAAVTVTTTDDARLDADNISVTATGGDIGPATQLVVYDSDSGNLLKHFAFASPQTAGQGTPFNVSWHADGVINWVYTA